MDAFPAFVPLAGARVVVAGEGEAADAKARLFDGSPAELVRVAGEAALDPAAYAGARIVFVAGDEAWSRAAADAARAAGAWVNAVDRPELCDFNTPGVIDRGAVVGAVGTVGAAPVLAVRLRQEIEARWPRGLGGVAELMRALRPAIREGAADWAERRRLLAALMRGPWAEAALDRRPAEAERLARAALEAGTLGKAAGAILLVAVPNPADLLTLRAARLLGAADRLVLAGAVAPEVLDLARRDAPREPWTGDTAPLLAALAAREITAVAGSVATVGAALDAAGLPWSHA